MSNAKVKYTPNFIRITNRNCSHKKNLKIKIKIKSHDWWKKIVFCVWIPFLFHFTFHKLQKIRALHMGITTTNWSEPMWMGFFLLSEKFNRNSVAASFQMTRPLLTKHLSSRVSTNFTRVSFPHQFKPDLHKQRRSTVALYIQSRMHTYAQTQTPAQTYIKIATVEQWACMRIRARPLLPVCLPLCVCACACESHCCEWVRVDFKKIYFLTVAHTRMACTERIKSAFEIAF